MNDDHLDWNGRMYNLTSVDGGALCLNVPGLNNVEAFLRQRMLDIGEGIYPTKFKRAKMEAQQEIFIEEAEFLI